MKPTNITLILITLLLLCIPITTLANPLSDVAQEGVKQLTTTLSGKIVKASETEVYIALGEQNGIVQGNRFTLIRCGEPVKVDGEVIGCDENVIGTATAVRVRPRLSICEVNDLQTIPRRGDTATVARPVLKRVLVLDFPHNNNVDQLSRELKKNFIFAFGRRHIQAKGGGQLSSAQLTDPEQARQLAEGAGMDAVLLGTLKGAGNAVAMEGTLFDARSGEVLGVVENEIAVGNPATVAGIATQQAANESSSAGKNTADTVKIHDVTFHLKSCSCSGQTISCNMDITRENQEADLTLIYGSAVIYDMEGNTYKTALGTIQNSGRSSFPSALIMPGITFHSTFDFTTKVKKCAKGIALLKIPVKVSKANGLKLEFRNILYSN